MLWRSNRMRHVSFRPRVMIGWVVDLIIVPMHLHYYCYCCYYCYYLHCCCDYYSIHPAINCPKKMLVVLLLQRMIFDS